MAKTSKFWFKNEKEIMGKLGLKPSPRSGAGEVIKEDGYNEHILCQLKSTEAEQITIRKLDVEKLQYHSDIDKKIPLFVIQFVGGPLLLATTVSEIGNIANLLDGKAFEKAPPIEINCTKQKAVKKIRGNKKSLDEILEENKLEKEEVMKNETLSSMFEQRKKRREQIKNGRKSSYRR
jgi:hypothetical protein